MGGLEGSENVADMTLNRRFVIGLNALQEANREGETIGAHLIDAMVKLLIGDADPTFEKLTEDEVEELSDQEALGNVAFVKTKFKSQGTFIYGVVQQDLRADDGQVYLGHLVKRDIGSGGYWRYELEAHDSSHPPFSTLAKAKAYVKELLEVV
jgi:hypothetical protein